MLKSLLAHTLLFFCLIARAQDKIYLLNGECKTGKLTEVGPEIIRYTQKGESSSVLRSDVLLLEFANGSAETINLPVENKIYAPKGNSTRVEKNNEKLVKDNIISLNTLALCNSDISVFYEKLFFNKTLGIAVMGAYNFNRYAGVFNALISRLHNGKKNYDIGLTANRYFGFGKNQHAFYVGILLKYTDLQFSRTVTSNPSLSYALARGSQLCTIFTFGNQLYLANNVVFKGIFGLGWFNLRGDYLKEYNYLLNNNKDPREPTKNVSLLPKLYMGFNVGYIF